MMQSKTILITGGSGGIGRALVRRFFKENWNIHFTYHRNSKAAKELIGELHGERVEASHFDQGDPDSVDELLSRLTQPVDVLINNAALGSATVEHQSDDRRGQDRRLFEVNALGPLWLCEAILPQMEENGGGKIINISSVGGGIFHFPGFRLSDGMSKAALTFLTRQLAAETTHKPIDIFAVCPGATHTDMFDASTLSKLDNKARKQFLQALPKGRLIRPEEVAELCLFLAGEHSTMMHGAVIDASMGLGVSPGTIRKI